MTAEQLELPFPPVVLVPRDCGIHYGLPREDNHCRKCDHLREYARHNRHNLQYDGVPWIAIIKEE